MASSLSLEKPNTTFTLALFKQLSDEDKTKNIFYSPFSISSALAMVMLGARGNTAAQMSQALCFTKAEQQTKPEMQQCQMQMQMKIPSLLQTRIRPQVQPSSKLPEYLRKYMKPQNGQDDEVHAGFAELIEGINNEDASYDLSIANRLYGEQSYSFYEGYLADTLKSYQAELETVDFQGDPENARVTINAWVAEKTKDKIKDLLVQDVVDGMTRLVLVNAIYFKGLWDKQFNEDFTFDSEFRINKNDKITVKMMRQKSKLPFKTISEPNCKILEMPYKGKDLSMLIFLPDEIEDETTGLEELEKKLDYENFVKWTDKMITGKVDVSLPRFKMAEQYGLNDVLMNMGMTDAFDELMCDFSGMSPTNNLVMSNIVHKSFMEVNEEGTEAAAATAAVIATRSANLTARFTADHPFLFFIRHNGTNSILFAGRLSSPE